MEREKEYQAILRLLREEKFYLGEHYKVKRIGVFGSLIRGEQGKKSDVDLLVEFKEPIGLFKFIELEEHLSKVLNRKVDLVMKGALKQRLRQKILQEVRYL